MMRFSEDSQSNDSNQEKFVSEIISESMFYKLLQSEKDGERFWQEFTKRKSRLQSQKLQVDLESVAALEKGANYLTPVRRLQIGILAAAILAATLAATIFLNLSVTDSAHQESSHLPIATSTIHDNAMRLAPSETTKTKSDSQDPVGIRSSVETESVHGFVADPLKTTTNRLTHNPSLEASGRQSSLETIATTLVVAHTKPTHRLEATKPKRTIFAAAARLKTAPERPFAAVKKLKITFKFNRSGRGNLQFNDHLVDEPISSRHLAKILPELEKAIQRRMSYIGPRIGFVQGEFLLQCRRGRELPIFEFRDVSELNAAVDRAVAAMVKRPSNRRSVSVSKTDVVTKKSVKVVNEIFQQWAAETLRQSDILAASIIDETTDTTIDPESFKKFAENGELTFPEDQLISQLE